MKTLRVSRNRVSQSNHHTFYCGVYEYWRNYLNKNYYYLKTPDAQSQNIVIKYVENKYDVHNIQTMFLRLFLNFYQAFKKNGKNVVVLQINVVQVSLSP